MRHLSRFSCAALLSSIAACGGMTQTAAPIAVPAVPMAVAVPSGHKPAMILKGEGTLSYECQPKAGAPGEHEWAFVAPDAVLRDRSGKQVGRYFGGPTWQHADGSTITGKQLGVSPAAKGSIPLQLVQADIPTGSGAAFRGVSYIQRVNTMGGVAPATPCDAASLNRRQTVSYSADYVFYKR